MANNTRVASFFRTKRPGMLVGNSKDENLETLIRTIKEAKAEKKGIVFFLWQNEGKDSGPVAGLTVAVAQDRPSFTGGGPRRTSAKDVVTVSTNIDPLDGLFGKSSGGGKVEEEDW